MLSFLYVSWCYTPCNTVLELRSLLPLAPCSFPRPLLRIHYFFILHSNLKPWFHSWNSICLTLPNPPHSIVKCWDSNSIGDKGERQGRMGVNSDGFLRHWTKGASTLDLIVTEFRVGCGQTDQASACVLRPLNRLVLDFKMGGLMEWTSRGPELAEGGYSEGRSWSG